MNERVKQVAARTSIGLAGLVGLGLLGGIADEKFHQGQEIHGFESWVDQFEPPDGSQAQAGQQAPAGGNASAAPPTLHPAAPSPSVFADSRRGNHNELVAYVPASSSADECRTMDQELSGNKVTEWIIAFATPTTRGTTSSPVLQPACAEAMHSLAAGSHVSLAVGGWGSDHQAFLERWDAALNHPAAFIHSVKAAMTEVSNQISRPVTGLDISFEFPTRQQTGKLSAFVASLRQALPDSKLSMNVDCNSGYPDSFKAALTPQEKRDIDMFPVMAYQQFPAAGEFAPVAHHVAPAAWVEACARRWISNIGNAGKVVVGYPGYAVSYAGAHHLGDHSTERTDIWERDIPAGAPLRLEKGAYVTTYRGNWTSIVPPSVMERTQDALRSEYPQLGGAMVWAAPGMNRQMENALLPPGR